MTLLRSIRMPRLHTFDSLIRYRDNRLLWTPNFCSNSAQWFQLLTVGWLVLEISGGSALLSSTVIGVRSLPVLLMGPWAGALGSKWPLLYTDSSIAMDI